MDRKTTFEDVPEITSKILEEVQKLKSQIDLLTNAAQEPNNTWLSIDELIDYLPSHPAKQTIYGKVCRQEIPYHKDGKKLVFLKAEIDTWLRESGSPSKQQIIAKVMQGGSR